MRKLLFACVSAVAVVFATPAAAQHLHFGFGSGGQDGGRYRHHHGHHHYQGHYHHAPSFGFAFGPTYAPAYRYYDDGYAYVRRCRTVMVEGWDGYLRRVRQCS